MAELANASGGNERGRATMRHVVAGFYLAAGIAHIVAFQKLVLITPDWVPLPTQVILITGVLEIAGSIALVTRPFRYCAGVALAVHAICVWPANFKHAFEGIDLPFIAAAGFTTAQDWRFNR